MNRTTDKGISQRLLPYILAVLLCHGISNQAAAAGLLTPVGQSTSLAIKDHKVSVVVEDGYVVTQVEQVFSNRGSVDTEAVYSFPVPSHAAVGEFTYWIDGKPVTGEVLEKKKAREIYEQEKAAGRETALTEKDGYRTFDISVYPVRAGQDTKIRLVYIQSAHTDTGIGRYVYPLEEGGVDEQRNQFWSVSDAVTGTFSFDLKLKSSYPVDAVRLPTQPNAFTEKQSDGAWQVRLNSTAHPTAAMSETNIDEQIQSMEEGKPVPVATNNGGSGVASLDQDIVVYWRLQPDLPASVDLVTYKPDATGRGTFMLTVTPGDDLPVIEHGRDWVFVLDTSGSMGGKFATLADGVQRSLGQLKADDRFRIITFNNNARELTPDFVTVSAESVQEYTRLVSQLQSGGGTNLFAGLQLGLKSLDSDRTSGIALVTDGVANVGVTEKKQFIKLLKEKDVRLFTFILGNSANRPLLEAMTEVSNGFAMETSNSDDIAGQLMQATGKINHAAMHDVRLNISGVKTADLTPARIGSVYYGEQLIVLGHYWGSGTAELKFTAKVAGHKVDYSTDFQMPAQSTLNPELERIWAYGTIENLQQELDYFGADADIEQAITDLAVEYSLVTDQTSMLVVREEVFAAEGIERRNQKRVAEEHAQRNVRESQAPQQRRVDQHRPISNAKRPSFGGGGGAMGIPAFIVLLGVAVARLRKRD